jgi:hypothetical protein
MTPKGEYYHLITACKATKEEQANSCRKQLKEHTPPARSQRWQLDERAARLNISRQAVIKSLLARALSQEREKRPQSKKGRLKRKSAPGHAR